MYIIAGGTESYGTGDRDIYLIKMDADGNESWSQTFGGSSSDEGHSVQQTTDGGYIIAGYTHSYGAGGSDVYLIRLASEGTLVEGFGKNQPSAFTLYPPSPNPFNASTAISYQLQAASDVELVVYDVQSREVARLVGGNMLAGEYEVLFDGGNLPSGVYFAHFAAGNFQQTRKIILLK